MTERLAVRTRAGNYYGYIEGDTYVKLVHSSRHMLKKPEAWAIDADSFDKLIKPACKRIIIIDKDAGVKYSSSISNFIDNKGEIDRKYGKQYFMILEYWRKFT